MLKVQPRVIQPRIKGIMLVVIGAGLWGISGTAAQYLFQKKDFSPDWLAVVRMLVSGVILLLYASLKSRQNIWRVWSSKRNIVGIILFGIIGMLGVQYSYFAAIKYGNAATATILQYLSPVIITCCMAVSTRKAPKSQELIGVFLAMLGTFFIITRGDFHNISISTLALFWGISSAFAAAFNTLQPRRLLSEYGSMIVVGWGMFIGGASFSFIHEPWQCTGQWSAGSIFAVMFVILFGTLIAFCCYLESLKYIKATEASILSSVEPLSAAVISVLWLHVTLGIYQCIGTVCIIAAIGVLSRAKDKNKKCMD
ncbi:DMT family transporter [Clostridium tyrobutyricum]|uniref:DMT family transporter n=1 Tax=Clostridium tyrobutyricum TaxID=1519 RepID=UPI001C3946E4|nr:DMT family transporter [Clostridium tyrobutyricum]MBV4425460.1 DMT family transporter [Clostridium tyrobutyricum]